MPNCGICNDKILKVLVVCNLCNQARCFRCNLKLFIEGRGVITCPDCQFEIGFEEDDDFLLQEGVKEMIHSYYNLQRDMEESGQ